MDNISGTKRPQFSADVHNQFTGQTEADGDSLNARATGKLDPNRAPEGKRVRSKFGKRQSRVVTKRRQMFEHEAKNVIPVGGSADGGHRSRTIPVDMANVQADANNDRAWGSHHVLGQHAGELAGAWTLLDKQVIGPLETDRNRCHRCHRLANGSRHRNHHWRRFIGADRQTKAHE